MLAACTFKPGTNASRGDASPGGDGDMGGDSDVATPGAIEYVSHTVGKSSDATVTIASSAMPGATYVLAVSSKPFSPVASVSGLGATWKKVADQCGARSQTGASMYIGRGAIASGNVVVTMASAPLNTVAVVALYSGSNNFGAVAVYNALDASTCNESNTSVDVNAYSFTISAMHRVVAAVATRQQTHTPGAGLVQRVQDTQGSNGDTAGVAFVDGLVTTVAGTLSSDVDVGAVAVELLP